MKLTTACKTCGKEFSYYTSSGHHGLFCSNRCSSDHIGKRMRCAAKMIGRKASLETRNKISLKNRGQKRSPESIARMRAGQIKYWDSVGRSSSETELLRKRVCGRAWKNAIYERDNYTCLDCGRRGVKLHAHHLVPFAVLAHEFSIGACKESDLTELSNGVSLCEKCHSKTDSYRSRFHLMPEGRLLIAITEAWKRTSSDMTLGEFVISEVERIITGYKDKNLPHE